MRDRKNPYEQRLVRRRWWTTFPFYVLAAIAAAATVFAVVQENLPSETRADFWPLNVRVPPAAVWMALFAASLGWVLVRDQAARSHKPLLRYTSEWVEEPSKKFAKSGRYRRVDLHVGGNGSAIFRKVTWRITPQKGASAYLPTMQALHAWLAEARFTEGKHYAIMNVGEHSSMDPGEDLAYYFECTEELAASLVELDATFEFESLIGDRFRRTVSLLPHAGAPTSVSPPAPNAAGSTV